MEKKMRMFVKFLMLALAGYVMLVSVGLAQNTGATVAGTVTDPQGNAVPGADVVLTSSTTNVPFTTKTNGSGIYRITGLLPGSYRANIAHEGFKSTVKDGIELHVDDQISLDFSLQVGTVSQSVTVEAGAPLIESESTTIGQVIESRTIEDQPLNGRNVYDLVALAPGVIAQGGTGQPAATSQIWANNNYQIGGGFGNQSSTFIDGAPINVNYANGTPLTPTQDSIGEFKIETNNVGPEFGATGGGIINMVTRSGGDAFHGTAYEFLRNRVLDANTYFGNQAGLAVPAFTQNQYGVAVGGPVVRNKTFFFFSWENFALRQGNTLAMTVPTLAERAGDFSAVSPIYDPCAGKVNSQNTCAAVPAQRTQFPGNVIPASRQDPTSVAALSYDYPLPNANGVNNYISNYSTGVNSKQFVGRIDDNISSRQHLFGRYTYAGGVYEPVIPFSGLPTVGTGPEPTTVNQFVLGDNYTINTSTIAEVRVAYLRFTWSITPPVPTLDVTKFNWPASFNTEMAFPYGPGLCINGYSINFLCGNYEQNLRSANNNYSISGSLTKEIGRHTLSFGGQAERLDDNYGQSNDSSGSYSFSNGMTALDPLNPGTTGNPFASYLLGYGSGGSATQLHIPAASQRYFGLYANDQFKLTSNLTLNLGLRWEQPGAFTERANRATVFLPNAVSPLASPSGLPLKGNFALVASPDWTDRTNLQLHWDQFAPRVGFAYRHGDRTAIRSGFGMFFPPIGYNLLLAPGQSPVNSATTSWLASLDGGITPYTTLHNPYPTGIIQPAGHDPNFETAFYGSSPNSPEPIQPPARVYQWNFGVQQDLGGGVALDLTYAGARGTNIPAQSQNIDALPDGDLALGSQLIQTVPNPFFGLSAAGPTLSSEQTVTQQQLLLPYPQFTGVGSVNKNDRDTYYHALQAKLQKRFGRGGNLLAAYTWAKLISNTDTLTGWSEGEAGLQGALGDQDPNNLRGERSLSGNDVSQNLVVSYVLDLPFGRGQRWLGGATGVTDKLVSGWAFDGVTTFQAGVPLGISNAIPATLGGNRPNVVPNCSKLISGSAVSRLNGWFNTSCFSQPPAFSFGNESREDNSLRAAGINNWNMGIGKQLLLIDERYGLTFRTEFFNLFNRVQFGPPGTAFGTAQFGVISSQVNNPRLIQFGLRFTF
jgi:hypothetical protein